MPDELDLYRQHSAMSDPGSFARVWEAVSSTIEAMAAAILPLAFSYRGDGPFAENGIAAERIAEVNVRYAEDMLARITADKPITPGEARQPPERMVGLLPRLGTAAGVPGLASRLCSSKPRGISPMAGESTTR